MLNSAGGIKKSVIYFKRIFFLKVVLKGHHQFEDHSGSHNITSNISDYLTWSRLWEQELMLCAKQASLYFHGILHWIFKIFQGEVAILWTATGQPGKPQHRSQAVTPSPTLPAAKKGLGLASSCAEGNVLGSSQEQRNAGVDFQNRTFVFCNTPQP